ncbi:hypothetical protein [Fuerstiella marisgermanici]|uniref:Uncharacterized protein n=1 Tax=Fuerstiella marisgermanici TaxID=1891926 RepID=A0A1P8WEI5_9PLAN|nr:hypothetical protein [Fuerstiella marisgermanici]APZ92459.1 hypothetical protein Fuma_02070 [Fuerstiella marisgermanici]
MPPAADSKPYYKQPSKWLLVFFALGCLALFLLWLSGRSTLGKKLAELRKQGLPTTSTELNDYYKVPEGEKDTTDLWVAAIDAVTNVDLDSVPKDMPVLGFDAEPVPSPDEEWEKLDESREFLETLSDEMKLVYAAAEAGGVARYPVDFTPGFNAVLPYAQDARSVARLFTLQAHVHAHDRAFDQSHTDILAIFALRNSFQAEPTMISQLIVNAFHAIGCEATEDLLPHCGWNDEKLSKLQTVVAAMDFMHGARTGLIGERTFVLTGMGSFPLGPFRQSASRDVLAHFEDCLEATEQPWSEAIVRMEAIDANLKQRSQGTIGRFATMPLTMLAPATTQCFVAGARSDCRKNFTVLALAAQRYRLKHGHLPDSLDDMTSEFLPSTEADLKLDHFDGQPLRFKSDNTGITIYSIGFDQKDDGGDIETTEEGLQPQDAGVFIAS